MNFYSKKYNFIKIIFIKIESNLKKKNAFALYFLKLVWKIIYKFKQENKRYLNPAHFCN